MKDYYQILGLEYDVGQVEIKQAYRSLAKQFHPDLNNSEKEYEERFKEIKEAYEVLGDTMRKRFYDQDFFKTVRQQYDYQSTSFNNFQKQPKRELEMPKFGDYLSGFFQTLQLFFKFIQVSAFLILGGILCFTLLCFGLLFLLKLLLGI